MNQLAAINEFESRDFQPGDCASIIKKIDELSVLTFANLSSDTNPVHVDAQYAKNTPFRERIVHGMLTSSIIGAVIGTKLPGPGCLYLKQELIFDLPVFFGDEITAIVTVKDVSKKRILTLDTKCLNQRGETVLHGAAMVRAPKRRNFFDA